MPAEMDIINECAVELCKFFRRDPNEIGADGRVKWPTKWARFAGDVMEVKGLSESLICHTLVVQDQVFHTHSGFDGLVVPKLKELDVTRGYLVTIDYHS